MYRPKDQKVGEQIGCDMPDSLDCEWKILPRCWRGFLGVESEDAWTKPAAILLPPDMRDAPGVMVLTQSLAILETCLTCFWWCPVFWIGGSLTKSSFHSFSSSRVWGCLSSSHVLPVGSLHLQNLRLAGNVKLKIVTAR